MRRSSLFLAAVAFILSSTISLAASARDQIRIVGSSTVFPFATAVAEEFGRTTSFKTPIIESTGSGGGLKLFCAGVGVGHPDVANASRRIKQSEIDLCAENGVTEITEVKIGYDGIVLANSKRAGKRALTLRQVFPSSVDLKRPSPKCALRWLKFSPVPSQTMSELFGSTTTQHVLWVAPF